jgi:MarR-like DNA-binding transcriptional regulator SgrR of sgrS sRNA
MGAARGEARRPYGGDLDASLLSEPVALDPAAARSHAEISLVTLVCDSLYTVDGAGQIVPHLAASLPVVSADGLEARIPLRQGVLFHDGAILRARDVILALDRVRRSSAAGWLLAPVADLADINDEVVVALRRRTPELARLLATPMSAIGRWPPRLAADQLICTGPFRLGGLDRAARRVVVKAWDRHFAGRPYADRLSLSWYDSAAAEAKRYQAGHAHLSQRGAAAFAGHRPLYPTRTAMGPATILVYLGFGQRAPVPLAQPAVRRAVSLAVARASFRFVGSGESVVPTASPVAPADGPARRLRGAANMAAARRELDSVVGAAAALQASALEIVVDRTRPDDFEVAKQVAQALFRLKVNARIVAIEAGLLAQRVAAGDCQLYIGQLAGTAVEPVLDVAAAFAAAGRPWYTREAARRPVSAAEALAAFREQLPIVPLFHRGVRAHHWTTVGGVGFDRLGRLSFADLFLFAR